MQRVHIRRICSHASQGEDLNIGGTVLSHFHICLKQHNNSMSVLLILPWFKTNIRDCMLRRRRHLWWFFPSLPLVFSSKAHILTFVTITAAPSAFRSAAAAVRVSPSVSFRLDLDSKAHRHQLSRVCTIVSFSSEFDWIIQGPQFAKAELFIGVGLQLWY